MKILVTGATGFVGSHLTDQLYKDGHELYSLIRSSKKAEVFNTKGILVFGELISSGKLAWIENLPDNLDVVIHTAGVVHSSKAEKFVDYNTLTTNNLVNQIVEKYPNIHFTFISSLAAIGPSYDSIINESSLPKPVSAYGKSKLVSEEYIKSFKDLSYSIIRPPMVIGPRDPAVLDIYKMVKSRVVIGPGTSFKTKTYSFVNVFDLVGAISRISINKSQGDFFISNKETVKFIDLINEMKIAMKISFVLYIPIPHLILRLIGKILKIIPINSRLTSDKVNELIQENWSCLGDKYRSNFTEDKEKNLQETILQTYLDYKSRGWLK